MPLRLLCSLLLLTSFPVFSQQNTPASVAGGEFQIGGTLVDADSGQPLAHAHVAIAATTQRDDTMVMSTATDGRFLFTGLKAGKYTLTGQARGHLLQSFNQHDQFSSAIAVGPDLESTGLVFKLPAESSISGTVTDEAGEAVRGASLTLYFTGLSAGIEATRLQARGATTDEGTYRFSHLAPGHYLIAVNARPWYAQVALEHDHSLDDGATNDDTQSVAAPRSPLDVAYPVTFYGGATEASAASIIALARGERFTADITLQPVPAVRLRLGPVSAGIQPNFFMLEQHVLDGPALRVMAEYHFTSSGIAELVGIPPGHYSVKSTVADGSNADREPSQEIDINSNGDIETKDSITFALVSATVTEDAGGIPKQLNVRLLNKKSRKQNSEHVDEQGNAAFKQGLPPGNYEVSMFGNAGMYLKTLSAEGAKLTGRTVELKPGANVKLTIGMGRGFGSVYGVARRNDKPLAGAMVVLVPQDPAHNDILFRRDQSDSDGTFAMLNVVPGTYTLLAIENGWELEWRNPAVLRKYMTAGVSVVVQPNTSRDFKIPVQ